MTSGNNRTLLIGIIVLTLAVIVLAIGGTYSLVELGHTTASNAQIQRIQRSQELALVEGCERLNIQRITANRAYSSDYKIASIFAAALGAKPRAGAPRKSQRARRLTRRFLAAERGAIAAYEWTPLTDCTKAVNEQGITYRSPRPIAFTKRKPPRAALGK